MARTPDRIAVCQHPNGEGLYVPADHIKDGRCFQDCDCTPKVYVDVAEVDRLREALREIGGLPLSRHDPPDRAYDLRQRLNCAVRWLREAEDIARIEMPAWPTADRIRDIYEQITEDVLNGKTTVPPLRERLATAEAEIEQLREALVWAMGYVDDPVPEDGEYAEDHGAATRLAWPDQPENWS